MSISELKTILLEIKKKHLDVLEALKDLKPKSKDFWDKFSVLTKFISAIIISGVGLIFTLVYSEKQDQRDALLRQQQLELSKIQIMEKFVPHLKEDELGQEISIYAIRNLGHEELAINLAALIESKGTTKALKKIVADIDKRNEVNQIAETALLEIIGAPSAKLSKADRQKRPRLAALEAAIGELNAGAREIGGNNMGPWVKKYMRGREGDPWSVGFLSWCFGQAPSGIPFTYTLSGNSLLDEFRQRKWFYPEKSGYVPKPGDIMFFMKTPAQIRHVGIIELVEKDIITTIEGNTNDEGRREAYKVARRVRSYHKKAFGHVPDFE